MAQLLVRNLPDDTVATLKALASNKGRSLEAEHRVILIEAAQAVSAAQTKAAWIERLKQHQEETRGRTFTPSEVLVRESRDER